ncbi:hypothetical protein [Bosea beijingensis]|uniref:hypothetical protein n=1 Tax=Bosea beijingensis TaxID=3068632 RepID=UPI0027403746|nr:hypothetical protein [Bosea sp. REN20]
MDDEGRDLHEVLDYRPRTSIARLLPVGLLLIFIGLAVFILSDATDKAVSWGRYVFIAFAVTLGIGTVAAALWARNNPHEPLFTLTPAGIDYRIPWVRRVLIPWHEVLAVEAADIATTMWNPFWIFASAPTRLSVSSLHDDVTVVVVSKRFYDSALRARLFWLRGPGWKGSFTPRGSHAVQVALLHGLVAADRQQLRRAVQSRWLAFRNRSATGQGVETVPATPSRTREAGVAATGDDPRKLSPWQKVQIVALSLGIAACLANVAGLWQLYGQGEARAARAKAVEERRSRENARLRMQEEAKQRAAEDKRLQEENEAVLRKAFGR